LTTLLWSYQKWVAKSPDQRAPRFVVHAGHGEFVVHRERHGLLLLMSCNHRAALGSGAPVRDGEDGNCKPEAAQFWASAAGTRDLLAGE
jgi:hypothetical protein